MERDFKKHLEELYREMREKNLKPEEMERYQNPLDQSYIRSWRKRFPGITDEEIINTLESW